MSFKRYQPSEEEGWKNEKAIENKVRENRVRENNNGGAGENQSKG